MAGWLRGWLRIALALLVQAPGALAQEIDSAVSAHGRKPVTIIDEIRDPGERKSFLALVAARSPARKRALAESFLRQWPRSWLLAAVYEAAAKASIDEGDIDAAQRYGGASLRLLPENPLLLVPQASLEAQRGRTGDARRHARDAIEYLERFGGPANMTERQWAKVERQLTASAYVALGRAEVSLALASTGERRDRGLRQAQVDLREGIEQCPGDVEIAYVLGLADLSLEQRPEAAYWFRRASHARGPLGRNAAEQLSRLGDLPAYAPPSKREPAHESHEYAGSDTCQPCHADVHAAWRKTGMARMFQPFDAERVIGDFSPPSTFPDDRGRPVARMFSDRGRDWFSIRDIGGHWQRYRVDFTIGSKWQQGYATRLPDGRIQVFPLEYNVLRKSWVNYWQLIDPPGSRRADIAAFAELSSATLYQVNCAPCHTSQLHAAEGPRTALFREPGVNCEMCHGPSAQHVASIKAGRPFRKPPIQPPVDFRHISGREFVAICAQCHMQSALRDAGPDGEVNYARRGDFFPRYRSRPYTEFSRKAFYRDGRFRQTTFIVEAFLRSACFRRGGAHCGHCHDPHPADAAANPASLKYRDRPDEMCLQCHERYRADPQAHTRHGPNSEAARCVSCHMPRIMQSVLFPARTHRIDDVPEVEMAARFGPRDSPSACLICHTDKDVEWLRERLRAW